VRASRIVAGEFRPEEILRILAKHRVDYVLVGGLAAAIHGSDELTTDIDITPELSPSNLSRLSAALRELNALVRTEQEPDGLPFDHDAESLASVTAWNLLTDFGALDLAFRPAGTQGYPDLRRDAERIVILGSPVTVASLADVVRTKEAGGRPKDLRSLPVLRRLLDERRD
jgi:hypothetical protein